MRVVLDARYLGMVIGHRANPEMLMGVGAYSYQLIRNLIALYPNDEFYVITNQAADQLAGLLPGATVIAISQGYRFPIAKSVIGRLYRGLVSDPVSFNALRRRHRFEIVHYLSPDLIPPPGAAQRTVITVHDMAYNLFPDQVFRNALSRRIWNYQVTTWARAEMIITDSDATRSDLLRFCPIDPDRVRTVYCGVDQQFTADGEHIDAAVPGKYGIERPYFLHVGSIQPSKNLENLLAAFAIVRRGQPVATLAIAGELSFFPDDRERVHRQIERLGLRDAVRETGFVSATDLPALYRQAVALVHPSWHEGFGLTPAEAGACGCPSVISDRGSLPEIMGRAGLSVDPADPCSIAAGMVSMMDPETRARHAGLSKERSRRYTWRAAAARVHEIYNELLN